MYQLELGRLKFINKFLLFQYSYLNISVERRISRTIRARVKGRGLMSIVGEFEGHKSFTRRENRIDSQGLVCLILN